MNFAQTIKQYRMRNRLSQEELGKLAGVAGLTIGRIERGEHKPNPMTSYALVKAMKLTPEQINKELNLSDDSVIPGKVEISKPDNSMHIYSSEHLAYEFQTLKRGIGWIENLMWVMLTVQITTAIYVVFFVAK